jgi:hypothetical protein
MGHEFVMTEPTSRPSDEPLGALAHRLSEQIPELVRSELRLAQAELTQKGKRAGLGIGMFSAAAAPTPERTISNVREDVSVLKGGDA